MKITKVTPWIVSGPPEEAGGRQDRGGSLSYVFIQVETDEGLTGWGEFNLNFLPGLSARRMEDDASWMICLLYTSDAADE